jgi:hypothetical protein
MYPSVFCSGLSLATIFQLRGSAICRDARNAKLRFSDKLATQLIVATLGQGALHEEIA